MTWEVREADCIDAMKEMDEASVDAIVTDPPYGLEFMGRDWDKLGATIETANEGADVSHPFRDGTQRVRFGATAKRTQEWHQAWATEALRVLKPGGHLLAFGGTRTSHRLACAIEDAGFEIRDSVIWLYGSGFPKSLDVSKAIDRAAGAKREVVGTRPQFPDGDRGAQPRESKFPNNYGDGMPDPGRVEVTAPATPEAQRWQGFGTSLKPAHEPVVVARKPLIGTVAQNVSEFGTGALNIDGTRIGAPEGDREDYGLDGDEAAGIGYHGLAGRTAYERPAAGRWPANVTLSHLPECEQVGTRRVKSGEAVRERSGGKTFGGEVEKPPMENQSYADPDGTEQIANWRCAESCPVAELDRQSGEAGSPAAPGRSYPSNARNDGLFGVGGEETTYYGDTGGASRFFYVAKASRAERNAGLEGFEERQAGIGDERPAGSSWERRAPEKNPNAPRANVHPTVKPVDLMRWLVRLITPPGGTILDPFAGSGTTGIAAVLEDFDFIGIEREAEYVAIARARIDYWNRQPKQLGLLDDAA